MVAAQEPWVTVR